MKKKTKSERKTVMLSVRTTPEIDYQLNCLAQAMNMSRTEVVNDLITKHYRQHHQTWPEMNKTEREVYLSKLMVELDAASSTSFGESDSSFTPDKLHLMIREQYEQEYQDFWITVEGKHAD